MIQVQEWLGCRRLLIVPDEEKSASVQLDIFSDDEMGKSYKEKYKADALVFSLWVGKEERRAGWGSILMKAVELYALVFGCNTIALKYDSREAPEWVRQWYERLGYEEKVFGRHYSLMVKQIG